MSTEAPDSITPASSRNIGAPKRSPRSILLTGLALLLAGIFLFLAFRGVDWSAFGNALLTGHYEFLLLTVPISTASYFLRSVRWGVFVQSGKPVPASSIFWANMAGYMGNAVLPARAGELLRSGLLGGKSGLGTGFVLATALVERVFDLIALVLIGSTALLLQPDISRELSIGLAAMMVAGGLGLLGFLAVPYLRNTILGLLNRLPGKGRAADLIRGQAARFLNGIQSLHDARRLGLFVLLTAVIWLADGFGVTIGVRIIHQTLALGPALVLLAALGLSSAIPSTPGYIGPYQFAAVAVLVPFGFPQADALAYILILQVVNLCLVSFWGLIGLWHFRSDSSKKE